MLLHFNIFWTISHSKLWSLSCINLLSERNFFSNLLSDWCIMHLYKLKSLKKSVKSQKSKNGTYLETLIFQNHPNLDKLKMILKKLWNSWWTTSEELTKNPLLFQKINKNKKESIILINRKKSNLTLSISIHKTNKNFIMSRLFSKFWNQH